MSNHYDQVAHDYQKRSETGIWSWVREREYQRVSRYFSTAARTGRILELGCGTGFYFRRLHQSGYTKLTAIEKNLSMIQQIPRNIGELRNADFEKDSLGGPFDFILCAGALEFTENPESIFCKIAEALTIQGRFILLYPPARLFGLFYKAYHQARGHRIWLFQENQIKKWAKAAGLSIRESHPVYPLSQVTLFERTSKKESCDHHGG